jgi:hypothetical protein
LQKVVPGPCSSPAYLPPNASGQTAITLYDAATSALVSYVICAARTARTQGFGGELKNLPSGETISLGPSFMYLTKLIGEPMKIVPTTDDNDGRDAFIALVRARSL